jgi:hypothetical protein
MINTVLNVKYVYFKDVEKLVKLHMVSPINTAILKSIHC